MGSLRRSELNQAVVTLSCCDTVAVPLLKSPSSIAPYPLMSTAANLSGFSRRETAYKPI